MEDIKIHYDQTVRNSTGHIVQFVYGGDNIDGCFIEPNGKYKAPFNIKRMMEEFPTTNEELSTKFVNTELDKLFKKLEQCCSVLDCVRENALKHIKDLIKESFEKVYINEKNFQKVMKMIYEKYERGVIQPSEMVGLISGQSIGKFLPKVNINYLSIHIQIAGTPLEPYLLLFS